MESKVVILQGKEEAENNQDPQKVYYEYVTDTVEKNMPAIQVSQMMERLRVLFVAAQGTPGFEVARFKTELRRSDPAIDRFAREHPRFFDNTLSRFSTEADLEMMRKMLQFRAAVESGQLPEDTARALLNELLIKHNSRPPTANREKIADQRLERKVQEGSYLGFDARSIPDLRRAAAPALDAQKQNK
jgi:hypothetical protein